MPNDPSVAGHFRSGENLSPPWDEESSESVEEESSELELGAFFAG